MKSIFKHSFAVIVSISLLTSVVLARERSSGQAKLQQMSKELSLTEDQKTKLKPILPEEAQKLQELRSDTTSTRQQTFQKAKAIQAEYKPQIDNILTPEQQQKWQEMKQQAKSEARERHKSGSQ